MSAPNKNYDPVEVTALSPGEIEAALGEGLAAVAAATDLDELKAARLAHAGDWAPLTQARAEIGALPPQARAEAGKRVGTAQGQLKAAISARQAELEKERDERVLIEEAVDVTLPGGRVPSGARHPVSLTAEKLSDVFIAMGYEVAEGPEVEAEWFNFDALNIPPEHPAREMQDTLFIAQRRGRRGGSGGRAAPRERGGTGGSPPGGSTAGWCCARTPRRCRSGRCYRGRCRCTSSAPAGHTATRRLTPPTSRRSTRSRASRSMRA